MILLKRILLASLAAGGIPVAHGSVVALDGYGTLLLQGNTWADVDHLEQAYPSDGSDGLDLQDFTASANLALASGPRDPQFNLTSTQAQVSATATQSLVFSYANVATQELQSIAFATSANLSATVDENTTPYPSAFVELASVPTIHFRVDTQPTLIHLFGSISGTSSRVDNVADKQVYLARVEADSSETILFLQLDPGDFDQVLTLDPGYTYSFAPGLSMQSQAGEYTDSSNNLVRTPSTLGTASINASLDFQYVPEPTSLALLGGVWVLGLGRRVRH
jgi:hypothetical protein